MPNTSYMVGDTEYQFPDTFTDEQVQDILSQQGIIKGTPTADLAAPASIEKPKPTGPTFSAPAELPWYKELAQRAENVIAGPGSALNETVGKALGLAQPTDVYYQKPTAKPILDFGAAKAEDLIPDQGPKTRAARGIVKGAQEFASGMTTPTNAALLAATGSLADAVPVASKLISAGFSLQMLRDAFQRAPQFAKQYAAGDTEGAAKTLTEVGLGAAAGILAAKHAASPEGIAPVRADAIPTEQARRMTGSSAVSPEEAVRDAAGNTPGPYTQRYPESAPTGPRPQPAPVRSRRQKPSIPETGIPEDIARGVAAREDLARRLAGGTYADLSTADKLAVDDLIAQGNVGAPDLSTPKEIGAPPATPKPAQVQRVSPATPNPPTAALPTAPEKPETIALQVQQLGEGGRRVVMFPKGTTQPGQWPAGVSLTHDEFGNTYAYRPDLIRKSEIRSAAKNNKLSEVLGSAEQGMGAPDKSALQGNPVVVTARTPEGAEAQSTATDTANLPATVAATHAVMPEGGSVSIETPEQAVADRTPNGWGAIEPPSFERHPSVDLSDEELNARARNAPLPPPPGLPGTALSAWETVSRIVPDLASKIANVSFLPDGSPENAAINVKTGGLWISPDRPLTAETLWHELIHLDQPDAQGGRMALDPDSFNALELQARAGIPEALDRFGKASVTPKPATPQYLGSGLGSLQPHIEKIGELVRPKPPETPGEVYAKEQIAKREAAREGPLSALQERVKSSIAKLKAELVDSTAPILDAINESQKRHGYQVLESQNIKNAIDKAHRASSMAEQFIHDNGLDKVIRDVEDVDYLDQYLIAKHAVAVERLKQTADRSMTPRDLVKDQQFMDEFRDRVAIPETGETYEQLSQRVNQYSRKLLDYSVDTGLVDRDLAAKLKQIYPDYVPLKRIMDAVEEDGGLHGAAGRAVASLSKQTIVQKLEGSQREIENPLWSILQKTQAAFKQGETNKAARILAGYRDLPGFEGIMKELAPGEKADAKNVISFLDNGIKRRFETTPQLAAAAKSLDVHDIGLIGKILAAPGRLFKLFTTGINPAFIAANIAKDMGHTFVTSRFDKSIANPAVFGRALLAVARHDDLWKELIREGGGFTSFDQYRNGPESTIDSIRRTKSPETRIAHLIRHPVASAGEMYREMEEIVSRSEEIGRMRLYAMAKDAALKAGRTEADARLIAAREANNALPNYLDSGSIMRPLNATIPYLNAGIQGSRSFVRAFRQNPGRTAASIATALYFPVAMATLWNLSDPERRKAYRDIQGYEKDNNIIFLSPRPTKDGQNRYQVIKVGLPQGIGQLTIPLRRMLEAAAGLDPVRFGETAQALIGSVSPVEPNIGSLGSAVVPQAIKPTIQAAANYDFFRRKPKVTDRLKDLPPELQVQPYTSGTAIKIANNIGASPIKTEEFIKDTLGGMGPQILNASDRILAAAGIIPPSRIGGTSTLDAIASRFDKARGGEMSDREFQLRSSIETDIARRAIEQAKASPYYQRLAGNENLEQRYLAAVAARAKALVDATTSKPYYRRMEPDARLAELKKLQAKLTRGKLPGTLTRPIQIPITPPSQANRFAIAPPGDFAAPGAIQ